VIIGKRNIKTSTNSESRKNALVPEKGTGQNRHASIGPWSNTGNGWVGIEFETVNSRKGGIWKPGLSSSFFVGDYCWNRSQRGKRVKERKPVLEGGGSMPIVLPGREIQRVGEVSCW